MEVVVFKNHRGILILFLIYSFFSLKVNGQISFGTVSEYRYLKGSDASGLPSDWKDSSFDDSGWSLGYAPFWYGDGSGGTELSDMMNSYSTLYMRSFFTATNASNIHEIVFTTDYDDGFVIWINGEEVISRNAPANRTYDAFAPGNHESGTPEQITVSTSSFTLLEGINTIAVQGFNISLESSDFHFSVQMDATISLPELTDTVGISFSQKAGYYSSPFSLKLTSPDPTANLIFTLDGSNPQSSSSAMTAGSDTTITVDPSSTTNRSATPAFCVRASIVKSGYTPSQPAARTYIFPDNVLTQTYPGGDWPDYDVNGQIIDLEMDSRVVTDPDYKDDMDDAFYQIPSISITTNIANLFDPATGIYVNAWGHGAEWERECSVELIDPNNASNGFSINAGLRIRGGWSRHNDYPKHAFRLFFREEYGSPKLYYPLFEDEGVSEFDKIDLRCAQNYSWANGSMDRNTMVREVFSRDSQRDMGQPYTRSRYYHLYLNGMYWGLFQTQERSEARYASDYLGGNRNDYDVIKVSTENWEYRIEATDGNLSAWQQVYNICNQGFSDNSNYFKIQGKDQYGAPVPGGEVLVDIDNLIDYMILIFYTGNFDAPTSSFGNNNGPNNFYAIYNRDEKTKGFVFFNHDAEHSLMITAEGPGVGLEENRVTLDNMNVSNFYGFHPQWLHQKLTENADYRMRFIDRVNMHMTGNGALTYEKALARFNSRVNEIDMAVIAESARWGDRWGTPATKNDNWLPEIQAIQDNYFPYRTDIVLNQLKDAGLWTHLKAPAISESGTNLNDLRYKLSGTKQIKITNLNADGAIYYTTNGKDPRKTGGTIRSSALHAASEITLNIESSTIIKARIFKNDNWSPIKEISFISENDDLSDLKVTELNYHPQNIIDGLDTTSGKSFEFIEFKNIGEGTLNLSGLVLDSAVYYEFPENTLLEPHGFYVIATKPKYFYDKYGMIPSGNCENFFDNSGEEVLLNNSDGNELIHFTYDDDTPWPIRPDGSGYSLTAVEKYPTGDPNDYTYWMSSSEIDGSPFSDDQTLVGIHPVIADQSASLYKVFPNPVSEILFILSENNGLNATLRITDINGKLVYSTTNFSSGSLNLHNIGLNSGIYILSIQTSIEIQTEKIVVNR